MQPTAGASCPSTSETANVTSTHTDRAYLAERFRIRSTVDEQLSRGKIAANDGHLQCGGVRRLVFTFGIGAIAEQQLDDVLRTIVNDCRGQRAHVHLCGEGNARALPARYNGVHLCWPTSLFISACLTDSSFCESSCLTITLIVSNFLLSIARCNTVVPATHSLVDGAVRFRSTHRSRRRRTSSPRARAASRTQR